uniref:Uncharacterized protein n=1 Tax=Brassica oleracea TaxID=3712 RepID=A0A3P6ELH6_BRAOL|nr:unnamed protein product [Brassica oleracea]
MRQNRFRCYRNLLRSPSWPRQLLPPRRHTSVLSSASPPPRASRSHGGSGSRAGLVYVLQREESWVRREERDD